MKKIVLVLTSALVILTMALTSYGRDSADTNSTSIPSATASASSTPSNTVSGNWWKDLGEPKYGGKLTFRGLFDPVSFTEESV